MGRIPVITFIVVCVLVLLGCHTVKSTMDYYAACKGDASCMQKMVDAERITHATVSTGVSSVFPSNSTADLVGALFGSVVSFFVGVYHGRKRCLASLAANKGGA